MQANELISEHYVAIREFATPDGGSRVEVTIEGDNEKSSDEAVAPMGYIAAASLFHLYANGTALKVMRDLFGVNAEVAITMESK